MSTRIARVWGLFLTAAFVSLMVPGSIAFADTDNDSIAEHETYYVEGYPDEPSEEWVIAIGGRLYDNWINVLESDGPGSTHPAWPAANKKKKGNTTWRCKSCHGWDFRGSEGKYGAGSYKTGIKGVRGVDSADPKRIQTILRNDTHNFSPEMIPDQYMSWLAVFMSKGQYNIRNYVSDTGEVSGSPKRGKSIFQNVCAACHGYNGTALNWGDDNEPAYVGTESNTNPWEVFFKIRHGHPGVQMVSLAAFSHEDAANVLAYAKTLPQK